MPLHSLSLAGIPGASPASPQRRAFRRTSRVQRTSPEPHRGKRRPGLWPQCRAVRRTSYGQCLPPHPLHRPTGNHGHTGHRSVSLCASREPVSVQGIATCITDQVVWAGWHAHWALIFALVPVRYSCLEVCFATTGRRPEEGWLTTLSCMQFIDAVSASDLREVSSRRRCPFLDDFRHGSCCSAGAQYEQRACPAHSVPNVRFESLSAQIEPSRSNPLPLSSVLPPQAVTHVIRALLQSCPPHLPAPPL